MERTTSIEEAKSIMGRNFIGPSELVYSSARTPFTAPAVVPAIPFDTELLRASAADSILVLFNPFAIDGTPMNLLYLRSFFGIDPDQSEPCFYNQDWYLKESFAAATPAVCEWRLVKKHLLAATRSVRPEEMGVVRDLFPTALLTAYVFFAWYFHTGGELLWEHDYLWCSDTDHNGDRVYTGRYTDRSGVNKNGFSIHRHLKLTSVYGAITVQ